MFNGYVFYELLDLVVMYTYEEHQNLMFSIKYCMTLVVVRA